MMHGGSVHLEIANSIDSVDSADWNRLAGHTNPFVSHAFLMALECGNAVGGNSGWQPMHLLLHDAEASLVAAMPLYLKHHSYGEYVFDHSWANAYERAGGRYYPKLLSGIPFTPVTGPRFLVPEDRPDLKTVLVQSLQTIVQQNNLSSAHINFISEQDVATLEAENWLVRTGIQFHWQNNDYDNFDVFLANLSSRKRKNIRKERAAVARAGVKLHPLTGDAITQQHIDHFYRFYLSTIDRKWGGAYLTYEVFDTLRHSMAERMLLVMAEMDGSIIGGALNFIGEDCLYGRNWGADLDIPYLHFEACYYQAIEFAITHRLARVEAGAQGFHKVQRGYMPVTTYSAHHIAHDDFRDAVSRFLRAETNSIDDEKAFITDNSPFKTDPKSDVI